jgi:hypothetical protein
LLLHPTPPNCYPNAIPTAVAIALLLLHLLLLLLLLLVLLAGSPTAVMATETGDAAAAIVFAHPRLLLPWVVLVHAHSCTCLSGLAVLIHPSFVSFLASPVSNT